MKTPLFATSCLLLGCLFLGAADPPLTNADIIKLSTAGMSESFVLGVIHEKPAAFATATADIVALKKAGVKESIISAMMAKKPGAKSLAAAAPAAPKGGSIPNGTPIAIRLIDAIDSQKANAGDSFKASLEDPLTVDGAVIAPKGANAVVKLTQEKESSRLAGRTVLTVELVGVEIRGRMASVNSTAVTQQSSSRTARTAKTAAGTAALGALIGGIAGGGRGAAIGAGAGAAVGAGSQVLFKGQTVKIPSETRLTFTTQTAVAY